tara:strand:+ start:227 stop:391 length:165 start_codon:yes stop_codon:yes gene_type:complete
MGCGYSSMSQSIRDEIYEIEHAAIRDNMKNIKNTENKKDSYLESSRHLPVSMWG